MATGSVEDDHESSDKEESDGDNGTLKKFEANINVNFLSGG